MKKLFALPFLLSSCATGLLLVDEAPHIVGYSSNDKIETLNCLRTFDNAKAGLLRLPAKISFTIISTDDGNGFALLGNENLVFKIQSLDKEKFKSKITVHTYLKADAVSYNWAPRYYLDGCSEEVNIL
ncbi:hypothetical protein N8149_00240 [Gammaproteobacteria bacterium]|nr:hypothetical protein [Gammaproteobacteria bacterium]